jgi:fructosamine-3-kinase
LIAPALRSRIELTLAQRIAAVSRVTGGDINEAFALELADGQCVFLKSNTRAPATMFAAEARGLAFLSQAGALRIPRVLAHSEPDLGDGPAFLLLESSFAPPSRSAVSMKRSARALLPCTARARRASASTNRTSSGV